MSPEAPLLFNPLDPGFRSDPYPTYKRLRAEHPAYPLPGGRWVISRHADCVSLLRDPRASSDARNSSAYQRALADGRVDMEDDMLGKTPPFLVLDPPDHTRLRGLVSKAFTPKRVEEHRPRIQRLVDDLIDPIAHRGSFDVIEDFAYPLPVTVICELLGVPAEDHETVKGWSRELARGLDPPETLTREDIARRRAAGNAFAEYFRALAAQRRKWPKDDLVSALIEAEQAGDKLTADELVSTCIFLLATGQETTVNLIGNGVLALLRHPEQLTLLAERPSLAPSAVEEVLRYDAPVQFAFRTAIADIDVAGETISKGDQIIVLLGSANRDPAQFSKPDRFDITRADSRHLAFGFGAHFCLGAPLARAEAQIAFAALIRRFPTLELRTDTPQYRPHIVNRGLQSLPVGFST